jgi:hypothetical protein
MAAAVGRTMAGHRGSGASGERVAKYREVSRYTEHERGYRGWLMLFLVATCVGAAASAVTVYHYGAELRGALATSSTPVILSVVGQLVVRCSLLVATLYGLMLFARRDARTPTFWAGFLFFSVAVALVLDAISAYQTTVLDHAPFSLALWSRFNSEDSDRRRLL